MDAILVVDVQNDFCEGGALGIDGGSTVAHKIQNLLLFNPSKFWVATLDWHNPDNDNGGHFSDNPDFVDTWVPHCLATTREELFLARVTRQKLGADFHEHLLEGMFDDTVRKGYNSPGYSGFSGPDAWSDRALDDILKDERVTHLYVTGLATDHCVKATVLDALELGYEVTVLTDYMAGVGDEEAAFTEMSNVGATISRGPKEEL